MQTLYKHATYYLFSLRGKMDIEIGTKMVVCKDFLFRGVVLITYFAHISHPRGDLNGNGVGYHIRLSKLLG